MARRSRGPATRRSVTILGAGQSIPVEPRQSTLPPEVVKALTRKPSKYGNRPTIVDGVTFDSAKEAGRYQELAALFRAGAITDLRIHTRWPLYVDGLLICRYESDFDYRWTVSGGLVVEDVKGVRTPLYMVKRRLMLACYGVTIQEIE